MSEKFKTVITNEGFRYTELVKSDDKPKISLLDPIASNTAYSDAQLERLTYTEVISQASQIQTGKLTSKKINGQAMSLELLFDGRNVKNDYTLNTIFIYGQVEENEPFLFAVIKANQPQYINAYSESGLTNLQINVGVKLANINDNEIEIVVDHAALATQQDVTDLTDKLDKEIARADNVEKKLQTALTGEISRAKQSEQDNKSAISTEITRAKEKEGALQQKLDSEIARSTKTDNDTNDAINKIKADAESSHSSLQQSLTGEINRAKQAEQSNKTDIDSEKTRATNKENELSTLIGKIQTTLNPLVNYPVYSGDLNNFRENGTRIIYGNESINEIRHNPQGLTNGLMLSIKTSDVVSCQVVINTDTKKIYIRQYFGNNGWSEWVENVTYSELRQVVEDLSGSISEMSSEISREKSEIDKKINIVQNTANTGVNKANTAQSTADGAVSKANNAQNTANTANSKIDNLSVSGKNILRNTLNFGGSLKEYQKGGSWDQGEWRTGGQGSITNITLQDTSVSVNGFVASKKIEIANNPTIGADGHLFVQDNVPLVPNKDYTLSIYVMPSEDVTITMRLGINNRKDFTVKASSDWTRISWTTRWGGVNNSVYFGVLNTTKNVWFILPQLEEGTVATKYLPNPSDQSEQITDLQNKTTPQQLIKTVTDTSQAGHAVPINTLNDRLKSLEDKLSSLINEIREESTLHAYVSAYRTESEELRSMTLYYEDENNQPKIKKVNLENIKKVSVPAVSFNEQYKAFQTDYDIFYEIKEDNLDKITIDFAEINENVICDFDGQDHWIDLQKEYGKDWRENRERVTEYHRGFISAPNRVGDYKVISDRLASLVYSVQWKD
ncbi:alanine-zipper protein [Ligilactobacillus equi]|nr:alanine-zipper protein [Ligilactobacillus equi]